MVLPQAAQRTKPFSSAPAFVPRAPTAAVAVAAQLALHTMEQILVDNRIVLALVELVPIGDLSAIDHVRQQVEQR